jgi:hypothetical protein
MGGDADGVGLPKLGLADAVAEVADDANMGVGDIMSLMRQNIREGDVSEVGTSVHYTATIDGQVYRAYVQNNSVETFFPVSSE